ncbi:MAG: SGNH/GDSL hydrolase family protein, partial [Candidatus Binatia bacterium]
MSRDERRFGFAARLTLTAAGALVAVLAIEIALRAFLPRYLNPFEPDDTLGFRLKANFAGRYPWTAVRTDDHRHRVSRAVTTPSAARIVFVGDSVTFGFGVDAEHTYPERFGERIGRAGDVVNAAVPGYNLEQVLGVLRELLARERPQLVVYGL